MTAARPLTQGEPALRRLELTIKHKLDGIAQGDHEGRVLGEGSELAEVQLYQPGDDIRRIDWNLTARSGEVHVRRTIADRELETWLVIDGTSSLDYGTAAHEKRDLAASVAAAFGFLTIGSGNRMGSLVFDDRGTQILPPRAERAAVLALAGRLQRRPRGDSVQPPTSDPEAQPLASALQRARHLARQRGLVVVISDLLERSDWDMPLRALAARREVVVAHVTDPREDDLPPVGVLALVDPETGRRLEVQTSSRRLRERYAAAAAARRTDAQRRVLGAHAGYLPVSTDRDWLRDVVNHVVRRNRRR